MKLNKIHLFIFASIVLLMFNNKEHFGRKIGESCSKSRGNRCNFGIKCINGVCGGPKKIARRKKVVVKKEERIQKKEDKKSAMTLPKWRNIWKDAGCKTLAVKTWDNWKKGQNEKTLKADANIWATSNKEHHREGCYGKDRSKWPGGEKKDKGRTCQHTTECKGLLKCVGGICGGKIIAKKEERIQKKEDKKEDKKKGERGDPCEKFNDCKGLLRCRNGICGGGEKGDPCESKKDCAAGTVCVDGTCGQPGGIFGGLLSKLMLPLMIGGGIIVGVIVLKIIL